MLKKYSLSLLFLISNISLHGMTYSDDVPSLVTFTAEKALKILCDRPLEGVIKRVKTLSEPIKNIIKSKLIENYKIALSNCFPFLIKEHVLECHEHSMCGPVLSNNGKFFVMGSSFQGPTEGDLYLWKNSNESKITCVPIRECKDKVSQIVLNSQSNQALTGSIEGSVRLWDLATLKPHTLLENSSLIDFLALSPDDTYAVAGSNDFFHSTPQRTLLLFNLHTDTCTPLSRGTESIDIVAFSPNGKYLAVAEGKTLCIWDIETLKKNIVEEYLFSPIHAMAWSPNSELLITAGKEESAVRLWRRSTLEGDSLLGHTHSISAIAFNPQRNHMLTGSVDRTIKLWDMATLQRKLIKGYKERVSNFIVAPDGKHILTLTDFGALELLHLPTLQHLHIRADSGWYEGITSIAFNGTSIVAKSLTGKIYFWYLGILDELSLEQLLLLLKLQSEPISLADEWVQEIVKSFTPELQEKVKEYIKP